MKLSQNAIAVLEKRYISKDENGKPTEDVPGLFNRVASAVASADSIFDKNADIEASAATFYNMMTELEFLPNSPTLMNAGKDLGQLSACFVLPIEDSMEAIFEAIKQAALIHKSGGGTGFSFSRLRPAGSTVKTTGGVASGPISFMRVFNMATEAVKQGGTRRGANMGILRVDHPDILEFIDCKKDNADITNFNISVGITEKFMDAVQNGADYDLVDPRTREITGTLSAGLVFEKIVHNAWANGEPGIVFLDRLNRDNVVPSLGEIESTNPCGEQPLLPYESCNLGSINLVKMLKKAKNTYSIDYDKLKITVENAVHFLDNVIEINKYPLEKIAEVTKSTRKIGLGVMGFADLLLLLNIPYNSEEGRKTGGEIMAFINKCGHAASQKLAEARGAFPMFTQSILKDEKPVRNATITTIAPTGTLSILAGCSSGVEPVFAYAFIRNIMDGTEMIETNPVLLEKLNSLGIYSDTLMKKIIDNGSLEDIPEIPADIKKVFVCSHDIDAHSHVKMQAVFQKHCDNAVSKTVNMHKDSGEGDVGDVFRMAYELDCKGITIYRDGSRDEQVLNIKKVNHSGEEEDTVCTNIKPRPRSESTMGLTKKVGIGCGNLYITVNYDDYGICEVFTSTGKAGGCPSQSEASARLASIALRSGISVDNVVKQLRGIRCPSTIKRPDMKCTSCPDAIARVIKEVDDKLHAQQMLIPQVFAPSNLPEKEVSGAVCPDCSALLEHEGGCVACRNCGYSKCN